MRCRRAWRHRRRHDIHRILLIILPTRSTPLAAVLALGTIVRVEGVQCERFADDLNIGGFEAVEGIEIRGCIKGAELLPFTE